MNSLNWAIADCELLLKVKHSATLFLLPLFPPHSPSLIRCMSFSLSLTFCPPPLGHIKHGISAALFTWYKQFPQPTSRSCCSVLPVLCWLFMASTSHWSYGNLLMNFISFHFIAHLSKLLYFQLLLVLLLCVSFLSRFSFLSLKSSSKQTETQFPTLPCCLFFIPFHSETASMSAAPRHRHLYWPTQTASKVVAISLLML